jgi:hypothetical protein
MSGTSVSLAQFAQSLAVAGAGVDIATWTATIPGATVARTLASGFADAPFIEWFGLCGNGGDDTAVFNAAVQSGIPFRLGPKTYIVNGSWTTGTAAFFLVRGVPGVSTLRRLQGGTTGAWIGLECPIVDVEDVIFDANGTQVKANTWNVLVDTTVTSAAFRRCAFRNNSGSLGRGLAIKGNPAATVPHSVTVEDCEFSGNSSDGCGVFQAQSVSITGSRSFNNGGSGIAVSVFGTPSSSQLNQRLLIQRNQCWNNAVDGINLGTIDPTGASPPVYSLATPSVVTASVLDNIVWANTSYGIQAYGDYLDISGNQVAQPLLGLAGIVVTARYSRVSRNTLNVPGAYIGIDSGGCFDCDIVDNSVTGSTIGINPGGSQFVTVAGNKVRGCQIAMSVYDIEADGYGVPFPAPVSALTIERNTLVVSSGGTGISVLDGGTGIAIVENRFQPANSSVTANQALSLRCAATVLRGNSFNGTDRIDLNPNAQNLLEIPDVFDTIRVPAGGQIVDSLVPASVVTSSGQVSYLTVTNGGTGYSTAAVAIAGAGSGAQATAMVYGGSVIGFRVTNNGGGYVAGSTTCVITGDGSGATATVAVGTPLQQNRRIRLLVELGATVRQNGQTMNQFNTTQRDLVVAANSVIDCVENNGAWVLSGFYPTALLQSVASGDVTLAAPAGGKIWLQPSSGGDVMLPNLPTSAAGLPSGAVWRQGTTLNIV